MGCAHILWMHHTLEDYGLIFSKTPLYYDTTNAISISKNPVLHSRTKHIEVQYHFIREHVQNGDVDIQYISTNRQLSDIFTKPLGEERFVTLRNDLGLLPNPFS